MVKQRKLWYYTTVDEITRYTIYNMTGVICIIDCSYRWKRIARSGRENGPMLVTVVVVATDKRKSTGMLHVIAEEPTESYSISSLITILSRAMINDHSYQACSDSDSELPDCHEMHMSIECVIIYIERTLNTTTTVKAVYIFMVQSAQ